MPSTVQHAMVESFERGGWDQNNNKMQLVMVMQGRCDGSGDRESGIYK
jgi:hypothetical protein